MVAEKNITQRNGLLPSSENSRRVVENGEAYSVPLNIASVVDRPQLGEHSRRVVSWRTPHLGTIKMYINPQSLQIVEGKDISSTRTKAGFIIQYAGERLTDITMSGHTGSGGIEAINILESIFRSEQEGFSSIAQSIEKQYSTAQMLSLFKGQNNTGVDGIASALGVFLGKTAEEAVLNIFEQPFPTLASLASNIEMIYQGVTYRGFFKKFVVDEKADRPGIFDYTIGFTSYAKQGKRRNFMPWHRQPYNPADANANPLTFSGSVEDIANSLVDSSQTQVDSSNRVQVSRPSVVVQENRRDFDNGLLRDGKSLLDLNIEDTEV